MKGDVLQPTSTTSWSRRRTRLWRTRPRNMKKRMDNPINSGSSSSIPLLVLCLVAGLLCVSGQQPADVTVQPAAADGGGGGEQQQQQQGDPGAAANNLRPPEKKPRFGRRKKEKLSSILFPGVSPTDYEVGEEVDMWVEMVESKKTQVPFQYYDLPVCKSSTSQMLQKPKLRKNLGQKLQGYNRKAAPYTPIFAGTNIPCTTLCKIHIDTGKIRWLRRLIERQYRIHLVLDSLPVVMRSSELKYAVRGYPVGFKAPPSYTGLPYDEYFLYNHVKFTVRYREDPPNFAGLRIVGFDAHPVSVAHRWEEGQEVIPGTNLETCNGDFSASNNLETFLPLHMDDDGKTGSNGAEGLDVVYSYEVQWEPSETNWGDRWDIYMVGNPDDEIHIFSVVNSLMIVVFLTGAVATIMLRTLKRDISTFNEMRASGGVGGGGQHGGGGGSGSPEDEGGWKLMHGDVFRPPRQYGMMLCVVFGTGMQLVAAVTATLLFAFLGILSPMNKGQTLTSIIILYVLSGSVAGYSSSRLYKFFGESSWKRNTMMTATAFPGILVTMFLALDVWLAIAGAATAVSIWTILALFLLWVCVSTPLVFVGSYFGYRAEKLYVPVKTNQIARVIPENAASWYTKLPYCMLLGGLLPFGNICIEVYFIMGALWLHQIYYVMGILFVVVVILGTTCAEVSIVMCYLQLCAEDHQWWWRSFLNSAGAGIYMFLYSLWFLWSKLNLVGMLATMVYLTYMSMISMAFALFCGAVGTFSSFWFTKTIYSALKVD